MGKGEFANTADYLDIRDGIERFEELEAEREDACDGDDDTADADKLKAFDGEDYAVLKTLLDALKGSGGDHQWRGDWYPVTLIRDSHWMDYVRETAEDFHGKAVRNAQWPFDCIDWEKAADELQMDYSSVEFDGVTYWYR